MLGGTIEDFVLNIIAAVGGCELTASVCGE